MSFFSSLFGGGGRNPQIEAALAAGHPVVDVRSPAEFAQGHIEGALNVPLDTLPNRVAELKALGKPLVLCCASGMRSGQAQGFLQANGIECINAGGWQNLR